jgi:hypothetical protein
MDHLERINEALCRADFTEAKRRVEHLEVLYLSEKYLREKHPDYTDRIAPVDEWVIDRLKQLEKPWPSQ